MVDSGQFVVVRRCRHRSTGSHFAAKSRRKRRSKNAWTDRAALLDVNWGGRGPRNHVLDGGGEISYEGRGNGHSRYPAAGISPYI